MVALIKPQFEAGKERVGKKGVVRDPAVHIEVIEDVMSAAVTCGFTVCGLDHSPVKGPEGNIEYLLLLQKTVAKQEPEVFPAERITEIVSKAHEALTGEA